MNGLHMIDVAVIGTSKAESWRCICVNLFEYPVSRKSIFRPVDLSCIYVMLRDFSEKRMLLKNDPEVSGSAAGASPTSQGPFPTNFIKQNRTTK